MRYSYRIEFKNPARNHRVQKCDDWGHNAGPNHFIFQQRTDPYKQDATADPVIFTVAVDEVFSVELMEEDSDSSSG